MKVDFNKKAKLMIASVTTLGIILLIASVITFKSKKEKPITIVEPQPYGTEMLEKAFEDGYNYVHGPNFKYLYTDEQSFIDAEIEAVKEQNPRETNDEFYLPDDYASTYLTWRNENKEKTIGQVPIVELKTIQEELNTQRKNAIENDYPFADFEKYVPQDYKTRGLLTNEEIAKLTDSTNAGKFRVTYQEAVEDVELYFRALHYAYGAYYYWGGQEVFDKAEQEVYKALEGKSQITKYDLGNIINNALSFIVDSHFTVNGVNQATSNSVKHVYYFSTEEKYAKDENGYYRIIDGNKWYYKDNSTGENVTICTSLDQDGKLYYGLKQFCAKDQVVSETIVYLTDGTTTKENTIVWERAKTYAKKSMHTTNIEYFKENDIAYVAVRNFEEEHDAELQEFVKTGLYASKAQAIILDVRSNGGGLSTYCNNWFRNLVGKEVDMKMVRGARYNALSKKNNAKIGTESSNFIKSDGKFVDFKIPVIVLVDENSGSSGEIISNMIRTLSNSLVIGSNTYGCDFCADLQYYYLPNSGMIVSFGTSLAFYNKLENTDGIGYLPDIWLNPQDAIEYSINLIANYGLASANDSLKMKDDLKLEAVLPEDVISNIKVSLNFDDVSRAYNGDVIKFEAQSEITFWAEVNEKRYFNPTVTASSPNVRIYPNNNGSISVISSVPGKYTITVVVDGYTDTFELEVLPSK